MKKLAALSLLLVPACTVSTTPGYQAAPPPPAASPTVTVGAPVGPACADGAEDVSDLFDQARPLAPTSTTTWCAHGVDKDVFAITAPAGAAGSIVRYRVDPEPGMTVAVELHDGNRRSDHQQHTNQGEPLVGWAYVAAGTPVYLRLRQSKNLPQAYTLTVDTTPLAEPAEPNGDMATATPLALGATATGFLARPLNDEAISQDWYRVEVTGSTLSIDVDLSQDVSSRVSLFSAEGKDKARAGGGRGEGYQHTFTKLVPGTYYLKVDSMHTLVESGRDEVPQSLVRPYRLTAN
jgi:hypothetical protein